MKNCVFIVPNNLPVDRPMRAATSFTMRNPKWVATGSYETETGGENDGILVLYGAISSHLQLH